MNSGGEPERDDTGLPPVDIEIPDDARELDRDVQAYYRELRAERRRLRHRRLHGSMARDGILLPLLACCLILALITGTLLTVFTATSDQNLTRLHGPGAGSSRPHSGSPSIGGTATSGPAAHRSTPTGPASSGVTSRGPTTAPASPAASRAGSSGTASSLSPIVVRPGAALPAGALRLAGYHRQVALLTLGKTMLMLVPPACGCGAAVNWLAGIGASKRVQTYLVGTSQTIDEASELHSQLSASLQQVVPLALDQQGVLTRTYPVKGLTAVIVPGRPAAGQSPAYAQHLSVTDKPTALIRALTG